MSEIGVRVVQGTLVICLFLGGRGGARNVKLLFSSSKNVIHGAVISIHIRIAKIEFLICRE